MRDTLGEAGHERTSLVGDRAVRECLDAVEAARSANGPSDTRPHIAHIQVVQPEDVPRFRRLGVVANAQAYWAQREPQMEEHTIPFLGRDRAHRQYPFGDLLRARAPLACGSDWPVSTPDPLAAIHTAVTRTAYGERGRAGTEPFLPRQGLPTEAAFAAYTSGSARINHRDDAGVLRPGAAADLAVLDRDPFTGEAGEIGATRVGSTWIDGAPVFGA